MNGEELKRNFDHKWGWWRRFIAANPLTGFWSGVVVGCVLGFVVAIVLG